MQVSEGLILDLPAEITIQNVTQLKADWQMLIGQMPLLTIDAAAVQRIDTAGVQLLLAFVQEAEAKQSTIKWKDCPDPMLEVVDLLGLRQGLGIAQ